MGACGTFCVGVTYLYSFILFNSARNSDRNESKRSENKRMVNTIYKYYLAVVAPSSPVEVKKSETYMGGLGIFLKKDVRLQENVKGEISPCLPDYLWGTVIELDHVLGDKLISSDYMSLYKKSHPLSTAAALIGPLSLINHQCGAKLVIVDNQKIRKKMGVSDPPYYTDRIGAPIWTNKLISKTIFIKPRNLTYRQCNGSEITIDYMLGSDTPMFKGNPCICATCQPSRKRKYVETTLQKNN